MDREKVMAFGAIFAIAIMIGSAVLMGLPALLTGDVGNSGGNYKEVNIKLSDYKDGTNISINSIKDGLKYIPDGTYKVHYTKQVPLAGQQLYNNTSQLDSILRADVYTSIADKDGKPQIMVHPLEFHQFEDYNNVSVDAVMTGSGRFPIYNNHTLIAKGNVSDPANMSYQVAGNPSIVGSYYMTVTALDIIDGKRLPTSSFNTIANHIDDTVDYEYEYLIMGVNDFKTYYESVFKDSENRHVRTWLFEDLTDDAKERVKVEVNAENEYEGLVKTYTEIDDKVTKIEVKSQKYSDFDNVSKKIAEAIRGPVETETETETPTE